MEALNVGKKYIRYRDKGWKKLIIVRCTHYLNFVTRLLIHYCPTGQTPPSTATESKKKNNKNPTKLYVPFIRHQNMQNRTGEISTKTKNLNSNILLKN